MTDRVAVNCRVLAKPTRTGVGEYTVELLSALAARAESDGLSYLVFGVESLPPPLSDRPAVVNADEPALAHSGPKAHLWEQFVLPRRVEDSDADLLHTPAGNAPFLGDCEKVTTVHDISPLVNPAWFSTLYATLYWVLAPGSVRASDRLITVSEFVRDELRSRYDVPSSTVHVVPNGVSTPPDGDEPTGVDVPDRYFLFVGAHNPRKNLSTIVDAYRRYRHQVRSPAGLVLVGPPTDIFAHVDIDPVPGVQTTGYVSDEALGWFYRHALSLVFPSLYEGFGLPILEAMSAGTPVVTSNRGAMAETAGDAASLVDPTDVTAISNALVELADNERLRTDLTAAGTKRASQFSWERTAEMTARVFERTLDS